MSRSRSDDVEVVWPGKYDAAGNRRETPPRAIELVELHPPAGEGPTNELVWGDNLDVLAAWHARFAGAVDLVYADPPFCTGTSFDVVHRDADGTSLRAPAYSDRHAGGLAGFLAMLAPRLRAIHGLLAPHGSFYIHVDPTVGHAVKLLCDEVFGADAFQREIVWRIGWVSGFKSRARNWIRNHDLIFFYAKDPSRLRFEKVYVPHPPGYRRRAGTPAASGGIPVDDVWNAGAGDLALSGRASLDSIQIVSFSKEKTGYATQKNESLLRRILSASSRPGDLVLDPFCGSGTTLAVAEQMQRRWLGCDLGRAAVDIARARLSALAGVRPFAVREAVVRDLAPVRAAVLRRAGATVSHASAVDGIAEGRAIRVVEGELVPQELDALVAAARGLGAGGALVAARALALPMVARTRGAGVRLSSWRGPRALPVTIARLGPDAALATDDVALAEVLPEILALELHCDRRAKRVTIAAAGLASGGSEALRAWIDRPGGLAHSAWVEGGGPPVMRAAEGLVVPWTGASARLTIVDVRHCVTTIDLRVRDGTISAIQR